MQRKGKISRQWSVDSTQWSVGSRQCGVSYKLQAGNAVSSRMLMFILRTKGYDEPQTQIVMLRVNFFTKRTKGYDESQSWSHAELVSASLKEKQDGILKQVQDDASNELATRLLNQTRHQ